MAKKARAKNYNVAERMPDEINALKAVAKEFITKYENLENERDLLKQDQKELVEEYSDRLDVKTLNLALRTIKIRASVQHKDTFDLFLEVLDKEV